MAELVIKRKPSIGIKKFLKGLLYTAALAAINYTINALNGPGIPSEYVIYAGLGISILQSIKKMLEKYKE